MALGLPENIHISYRLGHQKYIQSAALLTEYNIELKYK